MCSERWSLDDEKQLIILTNRKSEVMAKHRDVLTSVIQQMSPTEAFTGGALVTHLTIKLIKHADQLVNALKPFTRKEIGVRVHEVAQEVDHD